MGVYGFYNYTKQFQKPVEYINTSIQFRIGIDALSLLYKYRGDISKIFECLKPILNHKLLFVFDGKAPESKTNEIEKRKKSNSVIQEKIENFKNWLKSDICEETKDMFRKQIKELEYESWIMSYEVRNQFKDYLCSKNYSFIKSIQEADAVLIDLYYSNYIDIVLSSDMDFLVAGIEYLLVPVKDSLKEILLEDILNEEEINKEQLKEVAILCGIDSLRITIIDDVSHSIQLIRHYGSIESIINHDVIDISLPYETYISDIKQRFYPNRLEPLKNVKLEHKIYLEAFKPKES
jgi:5'-3' exonuclease